MEVNFCLLFPNVSNLPNFLHCTTESVQVKGDNLVATAAFPQVVFEAWSQPKPASINRKPGLLAAKAKVLIRSLLRKLALSCKNSKSCHQQIRRT